MALQKITVIEYDPITKQQVVKEVERDMPNPRISEIQQRLSDILMALQATDYQSHKFADGDLTEEEYAPIRVERKSLREEYNQLEAELAGLQ